MPGNDMSDELTNRGPMRSQTSNITAHTAKQPKIKQKKDIYLNRYATGDCRRDVCAYLNRNDITKCLTRKDRTNNDESRLKYNLWTAYPRVPALLTLLC